MLIVRRFYGIIALAGMLAGCDAGPFVSVDFAQPFPANSTDLAAFPKKMRGRYSATDSSKSTLIIESIVLVEEVFDSLHVAPQPARDTLADLRHGVHLRHYRGWYYLSLPADSLGSTWQVQRLAVVNGQLFSQLFNPDSLRLRALYPATVQLRRDNNWLFFTLNPRSGPATRQVNNYTGLWLVDKEYRRQ